MNEEVKDYVELFTKIWKEREIINDGIAMVRPLYMEFENVPLAWTLFDQFMFGRYVLVAPVLYAWIRYRRVVLFGKGNTWIHFWSNKEYTVTTGEWMTVKVEAGIIADYL